MYIKGFHRWNMLLSQYMKHRRASAHTHTQHGYANQQYEQTLVSSKMNVKAYMPRPILCQIPNQSIPNPPSLSHLGEISLQHYPVQNQGDTQNDLHKDPTISHFHDLIKNRIAESFTEKTNYEWGERAPNLVSFLENPLLMEAASKEYMNQKTLNHLRKMNDGDPSQQVARSLTSLPSPICMTMPSLEMSNICCNSNAPDPPVDYFMAASTDYNMVINDNTSGFQDGSLFSVYNQGVANMFIACDGKNMLSPVGIRQVASMTVTSPERLLSIAAYSNGDGFSDIEAFDGGGAFSGGNLQYISGSSLENDFQMQHHDQGDLELMKYRGCAVNNQNVHPMDFRSSVTGKLEFPYSNFQIPQKVPQRISEMSNIFPSIIFNTPSSTPEDLRLSQPQMLESQQFQQQPHQPYMQFNWPSETQSKCYLVKQDESCTQIAWKNSFQHPQFPSEKSHGFQDVASESPALPFSSNGAARCANSNNPLLFSLEHKILLSYVEYKSSRMPIGDSQVSFMNYIHSTVCNGCTCNCDWYWVLLSHFDNCHYYDCHICRPVQMLCVTDKHHLVSTKPKNSLLGAFKDGDSSGPSSYTYDDMLPPSKRLKLEDLFWPFLTENGISPVLPPLMDQPLAPEGLEHLQQWPESSVSINSEVINADTEPFINPIEDPTSISEIVDNVVDNLHSSEAVPFLPEKLFVGHKQEEMDPISISEITNDVIENSDGSNSESLPILFEELIVDHKEEIRARTKFDQAKPEIKCDFIAPAADHEKGIKLEKLKIKGVFLTEFFTVEQIKEHISSLRQWTGQSISKEVMGNIMTHTVNGSCQLCAADKLWNAPAPLYCSSCGARIKRNVMYYCTLVDNGTRHCFCSSCYRVSRGGKITFFGFAISKAELVKKKNDEEAEESWVQCDKCEGWQHQICALFNDKRDLEGKAEYICPKCYLEEIETRERMPLPNSAVWGAKDLPSTKLSNHIEQRLFRRLKQEREDRGKVVGKNLDEIPGAADLVVRVVYTVDKQLKVKKHFLNIFHDENYPAEFLYRSKVILLFQKIEGVDVCLFGMHVQEFGSECGHPNQRCVYISYLDSVKYFRPETDTVTGEALRTFVYHEILIGYLDYCKKRGFATCYIWACPPLKGEDYFLYCHPENQKTPKSDKLRQWYQSMLRKAVEENIVVDVTNLYDHFFVPTGECNSKVTAARLPYFDGDYWSCAAEDVIRNIEQESGGELQRIMTKRTLKAMGHTNPSGDGTKDILLMQKLGQTILPMKDDFIMAHLQFVCRHCHEVILSGPRWFCNQCKKFQLCERCHDADQKLNEGNTHTYKSKEKHLLSQVLVTDVPSDTEDKDVILDNGVLENRHTFLSFCQRNHYQFDTLRRAKHSSMMILHHLHNPTVPTVGTTCSICHKDTAVDLSWQCEICPEFDVCDGCYQKKDGICHIHKLTQRSSAAYHQTESKESQHEALTTGELLNVLLHASQCRATKSHPCSYPNCHLIKMLLCHTHKCNLRVAGGCKHCKKAWLILSFHSRNCRDLECSIPRCRDLKKHAEMLALQSETRQRAAVEE